ncbi:MAG: chain-length determining protein [Prevotellaceae bacterium]|nr:chain-length determining protein [Prevotellaceae bacterium]
MEETKKSDILDIGAIFKAIVSKKKLFIKVLAITFVVSAALILCVPRYYRCEIKLAPESTASSGGALGSLASQFGVNIDDMMGGSEDAIGPDLYPDILDSKDFQVKMFPIHVKSLDGTIDTDYYTYLAKMQKNAFWKKWYYAIAKLFIPVDTIGNKKGAANVDPRRLTKKQFGVAGKIGNNIKCSIDKRTYVISILVEDQDALICSTIADSVASRLQAFITDYRTQKARNDLEYAKKLNAQAKREYMKAQRVYATYCDENMDVVLQSYKSQMESLENELQLKYNNYNATATQLQMAMAKVQEKTPAFTVIQGASVPIKPAGPKRMIFVLGMMIFAFIITAVWVSKDILFKSN